MIGREHAGVATGGQERAAPLHERLRLVAHLGVDIERFDGRRVVFEPAHDGVVVGRDERPRGRAPEQPRPRLQLPPGTEGAQPGQAVAQHRPRHGQRVVVHHRDARHGPRAQQLAAARRPGLAKPAVVVVSLGRRHGDQGIAGHPAIGNGLGDAAARQVDGVAEQGGEHLGLAARRAVNQRALTVDG